MIQIAPSLLSCDFAHIADEVKKVEQAGADLLHLDVMDGHFVPNLTIGPDIVAAVRRHTTLPLDVHLMITDPLDYIDAFADAGADMISAHVEVPNLGEALAKIKARGCKAGAVINPPTPVEAIFPYIEKADFILVMTVNPGFGGQLLIDDCVEKVRVLRQLINEHHLPTQLEVDGGVKVDNVGELTKAGATIVVAGSAIFKTPDYAATIATMRQNTTI